ncbi:hypothetical protein H6P81_008114 [Aristolochia fimbriata]|uniref:Epidermal patterning factor-like protein n=1 Tax=Aristolochia fimbriata TaxID=158543 RepID=A0AAV7F241_ARIFI|nr:hypothetical protein H6P81_008114 [Aristolochia fimbriata]
MDSKERRPRLQPCVYCFSICLLSACALLSTFGTTSVSFGTRGTSSDRWIDCCNTQGRTGGEAAEPIIIRRRYLSTGPGSSPPRCTSKCGKCSPCKPVHVAVPPGTPVTTEYYPEAWRCKCGNKLYMP